MKRGLTGTYLIKKAPGESFRAFVPEGLPPSHSLDQAALTTKDTFQHALLSLGRLDGLCSVLPNRSLFIYLYVRKEAVLSSQIEGTQSSLSDLLLFESQLETGAPLNDVQEVSTYVAALNHGLERLQGGFPMSSRLIRELHGVLLSKGRGSTKHPGEFRTSQNWIGGTRPGTAVYVPPPPEMIGKLMGQLEAFLHNSTLPTLVKVALIHAQFETIHPFLDGNGRVGRLLIPLLLYSTHVLQEPMLYLSLYFRKNRERYYQLLMGTRIDGDWESWIDFFMEGVQVTAENVVDTARMSLELFKNDDELIKTLGRQSGSLLQVHRWFQHFPLSAAGQIADGTGLSRPTSQSCLDKLIELGILREITGRRKNRIYMYHRYFTLLNEGIEPVH